MENLLSKSYIEIEKLKKVIELQGKAIDNMRLKLSNENDCDACDCTLNQVVAFCEQTKKQVEEILKRG
jgi:hypothetical protein